MSEHEQDVYALCREIGYIAEVYRELNADEVRELLGAIKTLNDAINGADYGRSLVSKPDQPRY